MRSYPHWFECVQICWSAKEFNKHAGIEGGQACDLPVTRPAGHITHQGLWQEAFDIAMGSQTPHLEIWRMLGSRPLNQMKN